MRRPAIAAFPLALFLCPGLLRPQGAGSTLVIINTNSADSVAIGRYYASKRGVPASQVCSIRTATAETIPPAVYETQIAGPVGRCLSGDRRESILYLATTLGVPLRVSGGGTRIQSEIASVDSELALLYSDLSGKKHPRAGPMPNPYYRQRDAQFSHPRFPMYLVTRLAGYDVAEVRSMIDRSLKARNKGKVVVDLKSADDQAGNDWLRSTAILLPEDRVTLDETVNVVYAQKDVIGYAGWGSNDPNRKERFLRFEWLPGAVMTEFVSTNARTFERPPDDWNLSTWNATDKGKWFFGSPQTMSADYIHEGATGASGHTDEPFLALTPRPDYLFPAYLGGHNLAESYYVAIPALSWMTVVIGDPLCRLQ